MLVGVERWENGNWVKGALGKLGIGVRGAVVKCIILMRRWLHWIKVRAFFHAVPGDAGSTIFFFFYVV